MFMGDRWSYPHQASAATYVWMPLQVDGTKISIPEYWQAWDIKKLKPADALNKGKKLYGSWKSNQKGDVLEIAFKGTHAAIVGETNPHGGYAKVNVLNAEKDTVYSSLVDFYSKYPEKAIRIITPKMPKANYTLQVEITGVRPIWTDKTKTIYGSDDTFVTIDNVYHF